MGDFLLHICLKERFQFIKRYFVRAVIQINMFRIWHNIQFLWLLKESEYGISL